MDTNFIQTKTARKKAKKAARRAEVQQYQEKTKEQKPGRSEPPKRTRSTSSEEGLPSKERTPRTTCKKKRQSSPSSVKATDDEGFSHTSRDTSLSSISMREAEENYGTNRIEDEEACQERSQLTEENLTLDGVLKQNGKVSELFKEILGCCLDPKKKFNKDAAGLIIDHATEMKNMVDKLLIENASLKATLKERASMGSVAQTTSCNNVTYASKLAMGTRSVPAVTSARTRKPIRPTNNHVVLIRPAEGQGTKSSEETKERLMQSLDPRTESVRIKNVRKTNNNGLVVETASKADLEKLKICVGREQTLKVEEPGRRGPKMIIVGIPKTVLEGNLAEAMHDQNPEIQNMGISKDSLKRDLRPCFQIGKRKEDTTNVVVETTTQIRNALREIGRLYFDWMSCRIDDYLGISRCYHCQNYGHIAKHCRQEKATCYHCAGHGHRAEECKDRDAPPKCAPCKKGNRTHTHSVRERTCPSYRLALERLARQTDYGGQE